MLISHLNHKRMKQSFSERRDAHNDTKNMWDMYSHFRDKFMELVPSFLLSSFLLARRSCTLIKIQYAIALFPMMGYRMAQESSQYHLRFRTYAGRKNSLLLLLILSMIMIRMNVQIVFAFFKVRISRKP